MFNNEFLGMGPVEPSSDVRQWAQIVRQSYVALVNEGFTPAESLFLIGQLILGAQGK